MYTRHHRPLEFAFTLNLCMMKCKWDIAMSCCCPLIKTIVFVSQCVAVAPYRLHKNKRPSAELGLCLPPSGMRQTTACTRFWCPLLPKNTTRAIFTHTLQEDSQHYIYLEAMCTSYWRELTSTLDHTYKTVHSGSYDRGARQALPSRLSGHNTH